MGGHAPRALCSLCRGELLNNSGLFVWASHLDLTEVTLGTHYSVNFECSAQSGWTFRGWVPPGAYRVDFQRVPSAGDVPPPPVRLTEFLSVQADRKGLVFDLTASALSVAGRLTLNGQPFPGTGGPYLLPSLRTPPCWRLRWR